MPTLETHQGYALWHYIPSLPASIVFIIVFAALTAVHTWKMFRTRSWFCIPFVIGGVFEVIGYAGRAASYNATSALGPYLIESIFLLLAPVLFAASLYMTLGRLIRSVNGEKCSLIPPRWLTRIFVSGDVISFLIQGAGAGILSGNGSDPHLGSNIIVGGLVFQVVIFAIFISTTILFHVRFRAVSAFDHAHGVPWQGIVYMLYVTSTCVMVRNIFRVVEYAEGNDGYLLRHEWGVYVFDASLMTITMAWFFLRYPSQIQPSKRREPSIELAEAGGQPKG